MEFRQTILPPPPTLTLYVYASIVAQWVRAASVVCRVFDGVARLVQSVVGPLDTAMSDVGDPLYASDSMGFPVGAREAFAQRLVGGAPDLERTDERQTRRIEGRRGHERGRHTI
jgi:hypothetical protein